MAVSSTSQTCHEGEEIENWKECEEGRLQRKVLRMARVETRHPAKRNNNGHVEPDGIEPEQGIDDRLLRV